MFDRKSLLAFVHIEKTGGSTLFHVLRRNFFMRHIDVRPFTQRSDKIFRGSDLKKSFWLNPAICSISGHSVKPFSDLETIVKNIKYITLLRDPRKQYVSHYIHTMKITNSEFSFEDFLKDNTRSNFQTLSLSRGNFRSNRSVCPADLEVAKENLTERFWVVGIIEEFDDFLVRLRKKLWPRKFDARYTRKNVGSTKGRAQKGTASDILTMYYDQISERNRLDLELYEYVISCVLPTQKAEYGSSIQRDVAEFQRIQEREKPRLLRSYIDYIMRQCYYDPLIGSLRICNGLSFNGRY